ncbi:MAG: hypothetical protein U2M67_10425 [Methanosarcina sp.]|nr:hypothetical protein [Methanosarcina sp.]MDY9926679.1 hypothetical protein [Methanosarcina sp.]
MQPFKVIIVAGDRMNDKLRNSDTHITGDKRAAKNSLDVEYRRNLQTDRLDFMSPVIEKITVFSAQEIIEMGIISDSSRLIHPEDHPLLIAGFPHAIDVGFGTLEYRSNIRTANIAGLPITLQSSMIKMASSSSVKVPCVISTGSKKQKKRKRQQIKMAGDSCKKLTCKSDKRKTITPASFVFLFLRAARQAGGSANVYD